MRRTLPILVVLALVFLVVTPAEGGSTAATGCGIKTFAYAGLQADRKANGVY